MRRAHLHLPCLLAALSCPAGGAQGQELSGDPAPREVVDGAALAWATSNERPGGDLSALAAGPEARPSPGRAAAHEEPRAAGEARHEGPKPTDLLPWVSASRWTTESLAVGAEVYGRTAVTSWASFESALESCFSCPPAFVQVEPLPLFYVRPPRETVFATKLRKLVRAKVYREIRHRAKREWKSVFLDHPGMSYDAYEARLYQINNIGRDPREYDAANMDSMALELKQDFLDKSRQDGEADIPLVAWGPMTVMDTGSLKFDLGALTSHTEEVEEEAEIGEERDRPLIATKDYRLTTTFQVDVDPSMALSQGDVASGLRRYGVDIELDVLSDVLQRRLVSFELELQGNGEGELKGFFNLVLKAR